MAYRNWLSSVTILVVALVGFVVLSKNDSIQADAKSEVKWEYQVMDSIEIGLTAKPDREPVKVLEAYIQSEGLNKVTEKGWELITVCANPCLPVLTTTSNVPKSDSLGISEGRGTSPIGFDYSHWKPTNLIESNP